LGGKVIYDLNGDYSELETIQTLKNISDAVSSTDTIFFFVICLLRIVGLLIQLIDGQIECFLLILSCVYRWIPPFQMQLKYPDFFGFKVIYNFFRKASVQDTVNALHSAAYLRAKFPDFMIGFDLVGHEDPGLLFCACGCVLSFVFIVGFFQPHCIKCVWFVFVGGVDIVLNPPFFPPFLLKSKTGFTLLEWVPTLLEAQQNASAVYNVTLPYFLHAGETTWGDGAGELVGFFFVWFFACCLFPLLCLC
jgi:hypothetical protein